MAGSWTNDEKAEILKVFTIMATIQKNYGREIDVRPTLQAWEFLMGDFSAAQVVSAMTEYMRKSSDMPAPADIIALMKPEAPRISQAEFIHAKEQWKLEGYPSYSYYAMIVKDYERENAESRNDPKPIEDKRVLSIVQSAVKRIG